MFRHANEFKEPSFPLSEGITPHHMHITKDSVNQIESDFVDQLLRPKTGFRFNPNYSLII